MIEGLKFIYIFVWFCKKFPNMDASVFVRRLRMLLPAELSPRQTIVTLNKILFRMKSELIARNFFELYELSQALDALSTSMKNENETENITNG